MQNFNGYKDNSAETDVERRAIEMVRSEKQQWETATAFVTDKIAFNMRNLIKAFRKNYWGIFDEPLDPVTQRKKIWIPLVESTCETIVKSIDLDTKDINFKAKKLEAIGITHIVRSAAHHKLDEVFFGEWLDMLERQLTVDGTVVWKTWEDYDPLLGKKTMRIKNVDLLNFYIEPTSLSIQEAYSVIERAVVPIDEFMGMDGWDNKEAVKGTGGLNKTDGAYGAYGSNVDVLYAREVKEVEVFERWGKMPKFLMTGKKEDERDYVEGHVVVSNDKNKWRVHLIEENTHKKKLKPYEECWYRRVPGRWYGKGIAETLLFLQLWINTIVNIRINRSYVSQLGLFKIRKGRGITPETITRLAANGAILVNEMDDIEQLAVQEASQSSFADEQSIQEWTKQVTSAYEAITGEQLPASTPATTTAIQSRNAMSAFKIIKDGIGNFLDRWLTRQALPIIAKQISKEEVIRLTGDYQLLRDIDNQLIDALLYKEIEKIHKKGGYIDPLQVEQEKQRLQQALQMQGELRFISLAEKPDFTDYDVEIDITNEKMDKGVLSQNLLSALQLAPEYKEQIMQEVFDLMGIGPLKSSQTLQNAPGQAQIGGAQISPISNPNRQLQQSNAPRPQV